MAARGSASLHCKDWVLAWRGRADTLWHSDGCRSSRLEHALVQGMTC